MSRRKEVLIRQFKNEFKAYLDYGKREVYLRNKLLELDAKMGLHSPSLSDVHYAQQSHDEKLAEYTERRAKYADELDLLLRQSAKVESVLDRMDPEIRKHMTSVYKGHYNLEEAAYRMHLTRRQFRDRMDDEILRAYRK